MPRADRRGLRGFVAGLALLALVAACSGGADAPVEPDTDRSSGPVDRAEALEPDNLPETGPDAELDPGEELVPELAEPDPEPIPAPPADREALQERARALLSTALSDVDAEGVGLLVTDEYGREVVAHRPDATMLPASTLKIVTAAAALSTFGPDARFRTRVEVTAPVDEGGVLAGDLVLIGSGDPVLATPEYRRWVYPARPRTPLEDLADAIVATGIKDVTGDLVGVSDRFDGPNVAEGWPDRYFSSLDARYAEGLTVDAGLRTIVTYPEPDPEPDDDGDGVPAGPPDPADADEADATSNGEPPPDVEPIVRVDHAADPAAHAAGELARLLEDRGVFVRGEARSGSPAGPTIGRLAWAESPPLLELLQFAVKRSDNQIADALFRAVGRARTGTGSFASGDRALRQVLDRYGVAHDGARFADGSGLSRDDRTTARLLVDLDRAMRQSRHAGTWGSLMAVTGRSGTLETRLRGTAADGRFSGKTGTLRDVSGLVGTVTGGGPQRYHLAVVANDPGEARWASRTLADELILLLVGDLDG